MLQAMRVNETLKAILADDEPVRFVLPRELITTDRVLQRWAVSIGLGLPSEDWDDTPKAKPPPLSDDVAIVVDECVLKAPPKTRELVSRWYKTPHPVEVMARRLRCSARNVYKMHSIALHFMRWRFENTGNVELCRMVR